MLVQMDKAAVTKETKSAKHIPKILITQARPDSEKSPYFEMARKFKVDIDFHPFIRVEGIPAKEFRKQKIEIPSYSAVIFTSRNAIDHFFRTCEEMKITISQHTKYFCITESVALYLQKFILYRKRKVFYSADGSIKGLTDVIGKHKQEKYLLTANESGKNELIAYLNKHSIQYNEVSL